MKLNNLSLARTLFYLSVLQFDALPISKLSLNNISIALYGSIVHNDKNIMISDLEERLNFLLKDHQYRDEFTFGIKREEYENINPAYYGKSITYRLGRIKNKLILSEVQLQNYR